MKRSRLRRSTPLKRTPLRRKRWPQSSQPAAAGQPSSSTEATTTPDGPNTAGRNGLRSTERINRVSKKRQHQNRIRTQVLKQMGKGRVLCHRCGQRKATDGHELRRRSAAGSTVDEANIRLVCRPCHNWIGANPREAIETGWAISRFKGDA